MGEPLKMSTVVSIDGKELVRVSGAQGMVELAQAKVQLNQLLTKLIDEETQRTGITQAKEDDNQDDDDEDSDSEVNGNDSEPKKTEIVMTSEI